MLRMLRTATDKITSLVAANDSSPTRRVSPYQYYMCYQDGRPFMVINAPSLEHAQYIVAGFSADHAWMLVAMDE